ncbi:hypothetical protein ARMGADRAFT_1006432 [Armillaria gallica]|uniref:Uncharacterized protein n=1 Tax=Armillaria gallica TaxID=47427 RepID=A0A2H3EGF5_ARMGA|nr:hypothetical protein ARMGADRAFT_1006432 [Armillaria gallica]
MNLTVSDLSTCLLSRRCFPPCRPASTALGDVPPSQLQDDLHSCQTSISSDSCFRSLPPPAHFHPSDACHPARTNPTHTQLKTYETSAGHPREPAKIVLRRDP